MDCKIGDIMGREYAVSIPEKNLVCRVRNFVIGNLFYQVMYVGPTGAETADRLTAFLNSFKLIQAAS